MKLVIDIPEEIYKASQIIDVKYEDVIQIPLEVIKNGTPLPKDYSRIEDVVSRNEITLALNEMDRYVANELTLCDTDKKFPHNEVFIVDDVYEQIVERLPPVIPQPKTGHWIESRCDMYECSECDHVYTDLSGERYGMHYCPNCGAKMESEVEG